MSIPWAVMYTSAALAMRYEYDMERAMLAD